MKKTKFIFTIVFTLITGLIIGAIVTYFLTKPNLEKFNFHKFHAAKVERLLEKLDLNEQQKQKFYDIHIKYLTRGCSKLKTIKPDIIQIIEEETKEMNSVLTPEQQKKFQEIKAKKLNKFKTKFGNPELFKKQFPKE
jgi:periplasmic protein CpxP/Spy